MLLKSTRNYVQMSILLSVCFAPTTADTPCPYKECRCTSTTINCYLGNTTSLPALKSGTFPQTELWISYSISHIWAGQLPKGLRKIVCSGCSSLNSVGGAAFNGSQGSLGELNVMRSPMHKIPRAVTSLTALRKLVWTFGGLTDNQIPLPSSIESLDLKYNHITNITLITFKSTTSNLLTLDLSHNPISEIAPSAFSNLTKLQELRLSSAALTQPPLALSSLTHLVYLDLSQNTGITDISTTSWPTSLETLSLADNNLHNITSVSFMNNKSCLNSLDLSNNPISNISSSAFSKLGQLQKLRLSSAALARPPLALSSLTHLTFLDLSYQKDDLNDIDATVWPSSLESLLLWGNNIKKITTIDFSNNISSLTFLDFSYNPISSISPSAFKQLTALQTLRFTSNHLTNLPKALTSLTSLIDLDLKNNRNLTDISTSTFPSSLQKLDVSNCNIMNLTSIVFQRNKSNLTHLDLSSNPISHIAPTSFSQLTKLQTLMLLSNRLARLPLALTSLNSLSHLDLYSYPVTLVCTCQESALAPWFAKLTSLTISGWCVGGDTITDFLTKLAPQCPPPV